MIHQLNCLSRRGWREASCKVGSVRGVVRTLMNFTNSNEMKKMALQVVSECPGNARMVFPIDTAGCP